MDLVYYGLASANGIESFFQDQSSINYQTKLGSRFGDMIFGEEANAEMTKEMANTISMMCWAARANDHRRSVVYRAKVSPELAKEIEDMYRKDPVEALLKLKEEASEIALAKDVPMAKKFWEQIPNPILDPYN